MKGLLQIIVEGGRSSRQQRIWYLVEDNSEFAICHVVRHSTVNSIQNPSTVTNPTMETYFFLLPPIRCRAAVQRDESQTHYYVRNRTKTLVEMGHCMHWSCFRWGATELYILGYNGPPYSSNHMVHENMWFEPYGAIKMFTKPLNIVWEYLDIHGCHTMCYHIKCLK